MLAMLEVDLGAVAVSSGIMVLEAKPSDVEFLIKALPAFDEPYLAQPASRGMRRAGGRDYTSPFRGRKSRR